jgi:hypothetical protein
MPKEPFPFRYRDAVSGKWVKARYVRERHEIEARYKVWEIVSQPEYRRPLGEMLMPWDDRDKRHP